MINLLKKYTYSLEKAIQKALKEVNLEKFHFVKITPQPKKVENKIKARINGEEEEDDLYPFILIRPLKSNQKYKNGEYTKITEFLIRIGIKNENYEEGFFEVSQLGEYLIAYFTKHPSAIQKKDGFDYSINLDNIDSYLQEELIGGGYWTYDIILQLNIPTIPHGDYYENNLKII